MKKPSFMKHILRYLSLITILLLCILGIFLFSTYDVLKNEIIRSSTDFLQIFKNEFNTTLNKQNDILSNVLSQGTNLGDLKNSDDSRRTLASISLHNHLRLLESNSDEVDMIVVYDSTFDVCLDATGYNIGFEEKNVLREYTQTLHQSKTSSNSWQSLFLNNKYYITKHLNFDSRTIAIYSRATHLLPTFNAGQTDKRSLILANSDGEISKVWGYESQIIPIGSNLSELNHNKYYLSKTSITNSDFIIYSLASRVNIMQQLRMSMMIAALFICAALLFMLYILRYTRREVLTPMTEMIDDITIINQGNYEHHVGSVFRTKEFELLQTTINRMKDEIIGLKIQAYEKKIELQDVELKSIRLQLKPHFFLNALTTITSLSIQGKNTEIKTYIEALSKNVRYMFKAGLHTLSVKEELQHVENYFEMQELKYPRAVFHLIDCPVELEQWQIPQMLIHTFIENEYKYAMTYTETLTVLIKIREVQYQNEDMLLIEIEDNGPGYPQDVLDYMQDETQKVGNRESRIGLLSIRQMLELMYERKNLVHISNVIPHGCMNRIYVPKELKNK